MNTTTNEISVHTSSMETSRKRHCVNTDNNIVWQVEGDMPDRRRLMHQIMRMMKGRTPSRTERHLASLWEDRLPNIVRRVELALYMRAASLGEYRNPMTLTRRVQYLVLTLHHQTMSATAPSKPDGPIPLRVPVHSQESIFMVNNSLDLIRHITSFLDGYDVLRMQAVNRFTRRSLPSCVHYLKISTDLLPTIIPRLHVWTSLKSLKIVAPNDITSQPVLGEQWMMQISDILRQGKHGLLEFLQLHTVYLHTKERNGTGHLMETLMTGACPKLQVLSLINNAIGDMGVLEVAKFVQTRHAQAMTHLNLQNNYIGETGFNHLTMAFEQSPRLSLSILNVSGNLVATTTMEHLCRVLSTGKLKSLTYLGLEDNFIDTIGVTNLAQVLSANVCPKLRELCIGDNSIDNVSIHGIFTHFLNKNIKNVNSFTAPYRV